MFFAGGDRLHLDVVVIGFSSMICSPNRFRHGWGNKSLDKSIPVLYVFGNWLYLLGGGLWCGFGWPWGPFGELLGGF